MYKHYENYKIATVLAVSAYFGLWTVHKRCNECIKTNYRWKKEEEIFMKALDYRILLLCNAGYVCNIIE